MDRKHVHMTLAGGFLTGILAATLVTTAAADDWPWWRGPHRDGISREKSWSVEGRPDDLWKANVGLGYSNVSIADGRLYTLGFDTETEEDVVWCLDSLTGETLWTHRYPAQIWARSHKGGTLATPSIDGDRVFTSDREGKMFCFDAKSGEVIWSRALREDFNLSYPTWGFAASPYILDDVVIMNVGTVVALRKDTGEEVWRSSENYGDAYSTPVHFGLNGKQCLAVFNKTGLIVLDRSNGAELMRYPWSNRPNVNAATPVVIEDSVFISSGYNRGCALVDVSGAAATLVWENKLMRNKMSGCVLIDGFLYGMDEGVFKCIDLDGNERWHERGLGMGALSAADDKLIIISAKGEVVIAKASPEAFIELSRQQVLNGGVYWTTPVLANGLIYCRNSNGDLVCRDHRSEEEPQMHTDGHR